MELNLTPSCRGSWSTGVTERYLPMQYYTHGGRCQQSMEKQVCKDALTGGASIMGFVFFRYLLLNNESSRLSIKNMIALKVQLNVIQLTCSQSISQLSTKCTKVFKIKKLSFYSIYILK